MKHPLREIREAKKLTQSQCGQLLGMSGQVISQIERGSWNASDNQLTKIAVGFGLMPLEFIDKVKKYLKARQAELKKEVLTN